MKQEVLTVVIATLMVVALAVFANIEQIVPERYVWGRIVIPERGINAEVYITDHGSDCDCAPSLWNGGKVTVKADLSTVQLGDMADIYTVEGEHLVLECIGIRKGIALLMEPQGDVLVVNGRWVYRFTRL